MKIHNAASLRKFMTKHGLTHKQVALALGYAIRPNRYDSSTVLNMLNGKYNWEKNNLWVTAKLNQLVS